MATSKNEGEGRTDRGPAVRIAPGAFEDDVRPTQIQKPEEATRIDRPAVETQPGDVIDRALETATAESGVVPRPVEALTTQPEKDEDDNRGPPPPPMHLSSAGSHTRQLLEQLESSSTGQRFGRYWILDPVGAGGMAEVRLAYEIQDDDEVRPCVIKSIASHSIARTDYVEMFKEEERIGRLLAHPNIVAMYDSGEIRGVPFLTFELVDGVTAAQIPRLEATGRPPESVVMYIAREIARALGYAHALIQPDGTPLCLVHRDVSPTNILISRQGRVKLADFGIARFEGRDHQTMTGHFKGKMRYIAPEQLKNVTIDGRVDIFALGVVMAELLTGRVVYPQGAVLEEDPIGVLDKHLSQVGLQVRPALAELIKEMTHPEREQRPPTAHAVIDRIKAIERAGGVAPEPVEYLEALCTRVPGLEQRAIARAGTAIGEGTDKPKHSTLDDRPLADLGGMSSGSLSLMYAVLLRSVLDDDGIAVEEVPAERPEPTRRVHYVAEEESVPDEETMEDGLRPPVSDPVPREPLDGASGPKRSLDTRVVSATDVAVQRRSVEPVDDSMPTRVFAIAAAIVLLTMIVALVLSRM